MCTFLRWTVIGFLAAGAWYLYTSQQVVITDVQKDPAPLDSVITHGPFTGVKKITIFTPHDDMLLHDLQCGEPVDIISPGVFLPEEFTTSPPTQPLDHPEFAA